MVIVGCSTALNRIKKTGTQGRKCALFRYPLILRVTLALHHEDDPITSSQNIGSTHVISQEAVQVGHHHKGPEENSTPQGDKRKKISSAFSVISQRLWKMSTGSSIVDILRHTPQSFTGHFCDNHRRLLPAAAVAVLTLQSPL